MKPGDLWNCDTYMFPYNLTIMSKTLIELKTFSWVRVVRQRRRRNDFHVRRCSRFHISCASVIRKKNVSVSSHRYSGQQRRVYTHSWARALNAIYGFQSTRAVAIQYNAFVFDSFNAKTGPATELGGLLLCVIVICLIGFLPSSVGTDPHEKSVSFVVYTITNTSLADVERLRTRERLCGHVSRKEPFARDAVFIVITIPGQRNPYTRKSVNTRRKPSTRLFSTRTSSFLQKRKRVNYSPLFRRARARTTSRARMWKVRWKTENRPITIQGFYARRHKRRFKHLFSRLLSSNNNNNDDDDASIFYLYVVNARTERPKSGHGIPRKTVRRRRREMTYAAYACHYVYYSRLLLARASVKE